jgi:hypothetical protein
VGFGNNGLAKANLHGANDQKVLAGGDRESVGAGFTDSGLSHTSESEEGLWRWRSGRFEGIAAYIFLNQSLLLESSTKIIAS